jgi:hypothetical protein
VISLEDKELAIWPKENASNDPYPYGRNQGKLDVSRNLMEQARTLLGLTKDVIAVVSDSNGLVNVGPLISEKVTQLKGEIEGLLEAVSRDQPEGGSSKGKGRQIY